MSWQSKPDKLLLEPQRRLSRTRTSGRSWKCSEMCRSMKPAPPVIKIRIPEWRKGAQIQRSVRCSRNTYGEIHSRPFLRWSIFAKKFWRSEQSIVASRRYERECWFRRPLDRPFLANDESLRSFSWRITLKLPRPSHLLGEEPVNATEIALDVAPPVIGFARSP